MGLPPVTQSYKDHGYAVDFGTPIGTPIGAPVSGIADVRRAISSETNRYVSYGLHIVLKSGRYEYIMAHLSRVYIKPGDHVVAGQYIGDTGKTGKATGPHLHFEVKENGKTVNPLPFVGSMFTVATANKRGGRPDPAAESCYRLLLAHIAKGNIAKDLAARFKRDPAYAERVLRALCSQVSAGRMTQEEAVRLLNLGSTSFLGEAAEVGKDIVGGIASVATAPLKVGEFLSMLASGQLWVRVAMVIGGSALGIMGIRALGRQLDVPAAANLGNSVKRIGAAVATRGASEIPT